MRNVVKIWEYLSVALFATRNFWKLKLFFLVEWKPPLVRPSDRVQIAQYSPQLF